MGQWFKSLYKVEKQKISLLWVIVEQIDLSTLTMLGFDEAEYLLYDDDGVHKDYENEGTCRKIGK